MVNTLTQQQVEQALRSYGFQGEATGGRAQAFLDANPAAAQSFNQVASTPAPTSAPQGRQLTKQQVDRFLSDNGIQLNMSEADTMAAINANPSIAATWGVLSNPNATNQQLEDAFYQQELGSMDYGRLAENSYDDFTPYQGERPEFVPFSQEQFQESPDYQFRLEQGNKAIDRASSARGNFYSGKALTDATRFGSDMASNEYNTARKNYNQDYSTKYNRFSDQRNDYNQDFDTSYRQADRNDSTLFNRLSTMGGTGAINTGLNANNNYLNSQTGLYGAESNLAATSGTARSNNTNQIVGNLSSRFSRYQ